MDSRRLEVDVEVLSQGPQGSSTTITIVSLHLIDENGRRVIDDVIAEIEHDHSYLPTESYQRKLTFDEWAAEKHKAIADQQKRIDEILATE